MTAFLTNPRPADAEAFKNPTSNWKLMVGILTFVAKDYHALDGIFQPKELWRSWVKKGIGSITSLVPKECHFQIHEEASDSKMTHYLFHRCSASWFFSKSFVQNPFPRSSCCV